jgi:hypothetical protein
VFPRDLHDITIGEREKPQTERERERDRRHQHHVPRQHPTAGPERRRLDAQEVAERMW